MQASVPALAPNLVARLMPSVREPRVKLAYATSFILDFPVKESEECSEGLRVHDLVQLDPCWQVRLVVMLRDPPRMVRSPLAQQPACTCRADAQGIYEGTCTYTPYIHAIV